MLDPSEEDDLHLLPGGHGRGKTSSLPLLFAPLKALRVLALFAAYDLLRQVHLAPAVFMIKLISAVFLFARQKPLSSSPSSKHHHRPLGWPDLYLVLRVSVPSLCSTLAWLYGLTLCGPLRTVLVSEHSSVALLTGVAAMLCAVSPSVGHSRSRGALLHMLATAALLLLDHDHNSESQQGYHHDHRSQHGEVYTFFANLFSRFDVSDHKGGVLLLCLDLAFAAGVKWQNRRAAVALGGGAKRLQALSAAAAAAVMAPWAVYHWGELISVFTSFRTLFCVVFVAFSLEIADFYLETAASQRSDRDSLVRSGCLTSYAVALALGTVWTHPVVFYHGEELDGGNIISVTAVETEDHQVSAGVIFAGFLYALACLNLTSPSRSGGGARGHFVGYSADGLPLYDLSLSQQVSASRWQETVREGLKQILEAPDSRRIFYFLLLNFTFMFVEIVYGFWNNSLSLVSDAFHMFIDCSSLVIGLYAAVIARWRPTKEFPFGFGRLQPLSGFVNSLFLLVVSANILQSSVARLWDPPRVETDRLMAVSLAGLAVNLVGVAAFACGGHGHSHGGGGHHGHSHDANMQGVFLHIVMDTLGSLGVVFSAFLVQNFSLFRADPLCSLIISLCMLPSVLPLLFSTAKTLLLRPTEAECEDVGRCLEEIPVRMRHSGVTGVSHSLFWQHLPGRIHAEVAVDAEDHADVDRITEEVANLLRQAGVTHPVVQVQKPAFHRYLESLGLSRDSGNGGLTRKYYA